MDTLRNSNRTLSAQLLVAYTVSFLGWSDVSRRKTLENSLAQLSTEHVELLVSSYLSRLLRRYLIPK
jgi:hypothetical protein